MKDIEKGIKPLVDAINRHSFLTTVSSCEGHTKYHNGMPPNPAYVTFLIKKGYKSVIPQIKNLTKKKGVVFEDVYERESLWKPYLHPKSVRYMVIRIDNRVKHRIIPLLVKRIKKIQ